MFARQWQFLPDGLKKGVDAGARLAREHVVTVLLELEELEDQRTVLVVRERGREDVVAVAEKRDVDANGLPLTRAHFALEHGHQTVLLVVAWR